MGLTRTKFSQANTAVARIQDPLTVLNNDSTEANVDVGFIINRNQGVKSNVALYWNETNSEFTTAYTANTGIVNSNVAVISYANLKLGSLFGNIAGASDIANVYITGSLIPSSNISYDLGTTDKRFKTLWLSGNTIVMGKESLTVNDAGEWIFTSGGNTATIGSLYNFVGDNATTGNLTVTGNLNLTGNSYIINSTNTSLVDSIIDLHTQANLAPLTSDDGRDIGFKFHYYKINDEHAFLGWSNSTGYLEWYDSGREGVGNVFTGNTYGTIKSGVLLLVNNTPSTSTTTGALRVTGGVGIQGNLYITNVGDVSANIGTVTQSINTINANIGAYQIYANANAASQQTTFDSFTSNAASQQIQINNLNANIGSYQTFANANAGIQSTEISNIISTANANVAAYLLTNTGNIAAGNIATGNVAAGNIIASGNIYGGIVASAIFKEFFIGTTSVQLSRGSGTLTVDDFNTTGYAVQANSAVLATNATKTTVTSNVNSGTAYVTFVNSTAGNVDQNINTALTYNPNSGNLRAYGFITDTALYWAGNGAVYGNSDDILRANVGAFQLYANANIGTIITNLNTLDANVGAYEIYANANIGTLFNGNVSTNANIGAFQTYANTKIGTNTNSNLVVVSNTQSISTTTGALISTGGQAITTGNLYIGGSAGNAIISTGDIYNQGNIWTTAATNTGLKTNQTTAYLFNETATTVRIGGAATTLSIGAAGADTLTYQATTGSFIPGANTAVNLGSSTAYWGTTFTGNIVSNSHVIGSGGLIVNSNLAINTPTNSGITTTQATAYVFNETATTVRIGGAGVTVLNNNTQAISTSTGALQISGGVSITNGNLFIGGSAGNAITVSGNILPSGNVINTNNIGSDTRWWGNFYGVSTQARYADLAEIYVSDKEYEKGTVVIFGGHSEITISTFSHDTKVAGVVSTDPGYLMNAGTKGLPIAFTGRVPCKVKGPVAKGEVLVSSDIPGVAQRLEQNKFLPGCVIGKSLEDIIDNNVHTIEVVVGRF